MINGKFKKGISIVEVLVVVAVLGIIASIVLVSSTPSVRFYELRTVTSGISTLLNKARIQSTYSKNASKYSVRLFTNRAVLFTGTNYVEGGSTNQVYSFGTRVALATTSLAISTSTITFDRITGKTLNFGTISLWTTAATTTSSSTIIIDKTGIIETK